MIVQAEKKKENFSKNKISFSKGVYVRLSQQKVENMQRSAINRESLGCSIYFSEWGVKIDGGTGCLNSSVHRFLSKIKYQILQKCKPISYFSQLEDWKRIHFVFIRRIFPQNIQVASEKDSFVLPSQWMVCTLNRNVSFGCKIM